MKHRLFVLNNEVLAYFKAEKDKEAQGMSLSL